MALSKSCRLSLGQATLQAGPSTEVGPRERRGQAAPQQCVPVYFGGIACFAGALAKSKQLQRFTVHGTPVRLVGLLELNQDTFYEYLKAQGDTLVVVDFYTDCKLARSAARARLERGVPTLPGITSPSVCQLTCMHLIVCKTTARKTRDSLACTRGTFSCRTLPPRPPVHLRVPNGVQGAGPASSSTPSWSS